MSHFFLLYLKKCESARIPLEIRNFLRDFCANIAWIMHENARIATIFLFYNRKSLDIMRLIFPNDLFLIHLVDGYGLNEWFTDKNVEFENKQYFRRILDKYKRYIDQSELVGEFAVNIDDSVVNAIGCTFAMERQNTVVSLPTHTLWRKKIISGEYTSINDDEELTTIECSVDNIQEDEFIFCRTTLKENVT